MATDTGGAAFPQCVWGWDHDNKLEWLTSESVCGPSMTLLDWFAGQALTGLLANPVLMNNWDDEMRRQAGTPKMLIEFIAHAAYDRAAAMLAEKRRRERGEQ